MEIKTVREEIKSLNYLILGYDISSRKHNYYTIFEVGGRQFTSEGEIVNRTDQLKKHFDEVAELACEYGFHGVRVACEPTGGYEKNLMRRAREYGFFTHYVNSEATCKAKVIESNDSGKNDFKDSRIIHMLAREDKTLTCEEHDDVYGELKFYNGKYEDLSIEGGKLKNRISSLRNELFPDLSITSLQMYGKVGECIMQKFGFNPYRIGRLSFGDFLASIDEIYSRAVAGLGLDLVKKIWHDARIAQMNIMPKWKSDALTVELKSYYRQWQHLNERKTALKEKMVALIKMTDEWDKVKETPATAFMFSRVLAESGPWSGFAGYKQLFRFAGLNLREKQSGVFQGKVKLSKKGNILMRKTLSQLCFSLLVKKNCLYGDYFRKQKARKGGLYAMTCVMRKALKMFLGVYKSQNAYRKERVFDQAVDLMQISA